MLEFHLLFFVHFFLLVVSTTFLANLEFHLFPPVLPFGGLF
jgi:hypothetical protein